MAPPPPDRAADAAADAPAEPAGTDVGGVADATPAVFRVPGGAVVAALFLAMGLSPIAFQGGAWFALFALPLLIAAATLWVRTTVDTTGVHVRTLTTTTLPWSQVATLRLHDRSWVRAVPVEEVRGGRELTLVNVRIKDLGRVGEASGGRIAVPTPAEAEAAEERRRELEATRMRLARLREQEDGRDQETGREQEAGRDQETGREQEAGRDERPADPA